MRYLFIIFAFELSCLQVFSQVQADSLFSELENANDVKRIQIYNQLANIYIYTDTAKVSEYINEAKNLAIKNNKLEGQGMANYIMADSYFYVGAYTRAISYYLKSITNYKEINDTIHQIENYNSIGLCYFYLQKFEKSHEYYLFGLRLAERINNQEQIAYLYSNMAMVYSKMKDYQASADYYKDALEINKKLGRIESVGVNLNGIGTAYFNMEKYDSSKVYYIQALNVFKTKNNKEREAILLNNIANIYVNQADSLDKALVYYSEAIKVFKKLGSHINVAHTIEGLASVYRRMGHYRAAIDLYWEGIKLIENTEPNYYLSQLYYSDLAATYEELGNYKLALKYEKIQGQYADSLLNTERLKQITSLEKQFEIEKKEAEIGRLKAEQELSLEKQKKDKYLKVTAFVSAAFLFIALFYMTLRYYEKKKNNRMLAEKNLQIKKSEEELRLLNAAKNKFFSIIAHDLKSPFHMVIGYSQLLNKDYDLYSDEEKKKFAYNISKSANVIFRLLSNLLDWSRSQTNRISFNPLEIEFVLIYDNVVNVLKDSAVQKNITLQAAFDEELEIYADPVMLETVVRNLVNNAIKYTKEGGRVVTSVNQLTDKVIICIEDNGVGMKSEDFNRLFQIDSRVKQKGTRNEDGSGIGLILCKELVDKHGGKIWVESTPGKGSRFYIELPVPVKIIPEEA